MIDTSTGISLAEATLTDRTRIHEILVRHGYSIAPTSSFFYNSGTHLLCGEASLWWFTGFTRTYISPKEFIAKYSKATIRRRICK